MSSPAGIQQDVVALAKIANPLIFNLVASAVVLFWDAILTFDKEVEFIWRSKISISKVLYLAVRYLSLLLQSMTCIIEFGNISSVPKICDAYLWLFGIVGTLMLACGKTFLVYRLYAFYGRNNCLLWTLVSFLTLHITSSLVLLALAIPRYQIFPNPFPQPLPQLAGNCIVENYPILISYFWFLQLSGQTLLFTFAVFVFLRAQKDARKGEWTVSPLYIVFIRDEIWIYVTVLANLLLCGIYTHSLSAWGLASTWWMYTTNSICGTRLILNLHISVSSRRGICVKTNDIIQFQSISPTTSILEDTVDHD